MRIKLSRENFFASLSDSLSSNPKLFWTFFEISTKSRRIPSQVSIPSDNSHSTRVVSNLLKKSVSMFNKYFNSVFLNISEKDENQSKSIPATNELISDINIEKIEVYNVLVQLDPYKSCGPDNIPIRLLKECAPSFTPCLTSLFNTGLPNAILPFGWKLSNIIPLHKNGKKSFVENYRPISLMCVVANVLEQCMYCTAYYLIGKTLEHVTSQKDLGVMISSDLKWRTQIYEQVSIANRMFKRSIIHVKNVNTRHSLYLTLVRSHIAFDKLLSPQTITMYMELERLHRRATKFILSLPFKTNTPYETRLASLKMLPLCYWHEYLDILFLFKCAHGLLWLKLT